MDSYSYWIMSDAANSRLTILASLFSDSRLVVVFVNITNLYIIKSWEYIDYTNPISFRPVPHIKVTVDDDRYHCTEVVARNIQMEIFKTRVEPGHPAKDRSPDRGEKPDP